MKEEKAPSRAGACEPDSWPAISIGTRSIEWRNGEACFHDCWSAAGAAGGRRALDKVTDPGNLSRDGREGLK